MDWRWRQLMLSSRDNSNFYLQLVTYVVITILSTFVPKILNIDVATYFRFIIKLVTKNNYFDKVGAYIVHKCRQLSHSS